MTALSQQFPLRLIEAWKPVPIQRGSVFMRRTLNAAVAAMMDQPTLGLPQPYGYLQGTQNQLRAYVIRHRPTYQLPVVQVEHRCQIDPFLQRRYHELAD